jgi:hypothetical protein
VSYARFGWGDSDVYVFENADGHLECCACRLNGPVTEDEASVIGFRFPDSWFTPTAGPAYSTAEPLRKLPPRAFAEMIDHLIEHEDAGHTVPEKAFSRLITEQTEAIRLHGPGSEEK